LARDLKKSPAEIAGEFFEFLQRQEIPEIERLELVGPYINIFLQKNIIVSQYKNFLEKKELSQEKKGTIIVDYIGANVGKPLHIGHMCTPNIGQALINLHRKLGYTVIGDSHIGDWGIIFGKLIVAYELWGDEKGLEENAVNHLFDLYVRVSLEAEKDDSFDQKFRDAFKKLSE